MTPLGSSCEVRFCCHLEFNPCNCNTRFAGSFSGSRSGTELNSSKSFIVLVFGFSRSRLFVTKSSLNYQIMKNFSVLLIQNILIKANLKKRLMEKHLWPPVLLIFNHFSCRFGCSASFLTASFVFFQFVGVSSANALGCGRVPHLHLWGPRLQMAHLAWTWRRVTLFLLPFKSSDSLKEEREQQLRWHSEKQC